MEDQLNKLIKERFWQFPHLIVLNLGFAKYSYQYQVIKPRVAELGFNVHLHQSSQQ